MRVLFVSITIYRRGRGNERSARADRPTKRLGPFAAIDHLLQGIVDEGPQLLVTLRNTDAIGLGAERIARKSKLGIVLGEPEENHIIGCHGVNVAGFELVKAL